MERHLQLDTQITSHLLAALNLPPIRDVPPASSGTDEQRRDRPLPLEPSAPKDAYPPAQFPLNSSNPNRVGLPTSIDSVLSVGDILSPREGELASKGPPSLAPRPQNTTQSAPSESTPTSISSNSTTHIFQRTAPAEASKPNSAPAKISGSTRRRKTPVDPNRKVRRKWSEEETNDLIRGCHIHGVGNWKNILNDSQFHFNGRSSVDLKDRFRTCFPQEYRRGQAAKKATEATSQESAADGDGSLDESQSKVTKTELQHAEMMQKLGLAGTEFPKAVRKKRTAFTADEDKRLLEGFHIYGPVWSRIQTDPTLNLGHRRSTDLRDRFRNAFPDRYESAGFKARSRHQLRRSATLPPKEDTYETKPPEIEPPQPLSNSCSESPKETTLSLPIHGLLDPTRSPSWQTPEDQENDTESSADQSPAPGSLALDPALNRGFQESALEQITEEFLSVPEQNPPGQHSIVRWEDMATHPIFELEPAMTTEPPRAPVKIENGVQKRPVESEEVRNEGSTKRLCV